MYALSLVRLVIALSGIVLKNLRAKVASKTNVVVNGYYH
jgi:hypothetical protein